MPNGDREALQAAKKEAQFIIRNAQTPHEQKLELEPKIKGEPEISQKPNGSKNKEP